MLQLCPQQRWYQADGHSPALKASGITRHCSLSSLIPTAPNQPELGQQIQKSELGLSMREKEDGIREREDAQEMRSGSCKVSGSKPYEKALLEGTCSALGLGGFI